jgi:hypothetical protein
MITSTLPIWVFIWVVITHWISDFLFQPHAWAIKKSTCNIALAKHVLVYVTLMMTLWFLILGPLPTLLFGVVTFIAHLLTDYITSRWVSKAFKAEYFGGPVPNFGAFTRIGFDQVLHYVQLLLTLCLLL